MPRMGSIKEGSWTFFAGPCMNVWALNKDKAIKQLLLKAEERFGAGMPSLSDRWADDVKAVGLFKSGEDEILAYIHIHGESPGRYSLQLEYPGFPEAPEARSENLDLPHLLDLLAIHFDLADAGR